MLYSFDHSVIFNYLLIICLYQLIQSISIYPMLVFAFKLADPDDLFNRTKFLNVPCDSSVSGGGCILRESYCDLNKCVCKPNFINVDDEMCIDKYKKIDEACTRDGECGPEAYCASFKQAIRHKKCACRQRYSFSKKNLTCALGHRGAYCLTSADCFGLNYTCKSSRCECDIGFGWNQQEEKCYKKSQNGEKCDSTINCWAYDRLSECDPYEKTCVCRNGWLEAKKYALGQITKRCEECPPSRYDNETNTCQPETLEIKYSIKTYSIQYIYMVLSMTPLLVFGAIGFFYKYMRSSNMLHYGNPHMQVNIRRALSVDSECDSENLFTVNNTRSVSSLSQNRNDLLTSLLETRQHQQPQVRQPHHSATFEPPPTYEESILVVELPPSYEEAIRANDSHNSGN